MKKLMLCMAVGLTAATASAETPLWLRDVMISPTGSEIAFCYKGDIYKVSAAGGEAHQLTTQDSYECSPVWSPDGSRIAFATNRNGNFDIYVMDAVGGAARRLTTNSRGETPWSFTADGKYVVFSAAIQDPAKSAQHPTAALTELYRVPVDGGRTEQILATPAEMVNWSKDGNSFVYQDRKGFEDEWRKHHTSSITRDIWHYDVKTFKHTNLTDHAGEDRNPVLSPDGSTIYFLSERDGGSMNVYSFSTDNPAQVKAETSFATHPVRFLSMASTGLLCYTYDGEIYTSRPGVAPQKVAINVTRDDAPDMEELSVSRGASSAVVSPDGKSVAFVVRGEVFVTSVEYTTTKKITDTPAAERGITWAADNRTIAYASERTGNWQLYTAAIAREEDLNFPNATLVKEEVLLPSDDVERTYPQYSPDGKELAFIEDRCKLMVLNLATKQVRQVTDGSQWYSTAGGFSYTWSPDGKWFALEIIGNGHDPYSDVAIVSAAGGGKPVNITGSGYFSMSPEWVLDGNAILFITDRYGMRSHASWGSLSDAMLVFVNQDAYDRYRLSKEDYELLKELEKQQEKNAKKDETKSDDKKKKDKKDDADAKKDTTKDIVVELAGIEDRIVRVTGFSSDIYSAIVDKDGENLFFLTDCGNGYDLWSIDLRKKEASVVASDLGAGSLQLSKDGKSMFLLGGSAMKKMSASGTKPTSISYRAEMKMDRAAEREYMFDHVYKQELKRFYRTDMHGVDWEMMTAAYRKFLPHISNNYDFAELLSEYLGELNVSHTGGRYRPGSSGDATASLGLLYDFAYIGDGLKVDEVIEKGPFDNKNTKLKAGDIIEKINGVDIKAETDYAALLNDLRGKKTLVSIYNSASGERWDEVVLPISAGMESDLLYSRWVKQRAADVERWSNGRLGYVHIESMDDGSFRTVYSDILGKYNQREGIVIDTRFNGGGRLHEDVEILFSGKQYFTQVVRGREACPMPSRRWNKPSIMVQCEANYSNAHGTPWVYKFREIGKLVGMPVPGTMTSVSWERLQDSSLIFGIPVVGYRLPDGSYLENSELDPDIKVANAPETLVAGEDTQLRVAVETLLRDLDANK